MGERGCHPAGQGLVARAPLEWVHPDDLVGNPAEAGHLGGEKVGVAAVEAVGAQHYNGSPHRHMLAVVVEETAQRLADARAAVPVEHLSLIHI